jgi:DNA replication and repair protein RecF
MINNIHILNYRSYQNEVFEFDSNLNVIVGPNAIGKTNLIEAILVLCQGKSYRAKDQELIAFNAEYALIESLIEGQARSVQIEPQSKTFLINTKKLKRLSPQNKIPVVMFEPNHLSLLEGSKNERKRYLDSLIAEENPSYNRIVREYDRLIMQRNKLLKTINSKNKEFFPWNLRISQTGGLINAQRRAVVDKINLSIQEIYNQISGTKTSIKLNYLSSLNTKNYEANLLRFLENNIEEDKLKGFSMYGPHREDFRVIINNAPSNQSASRGETRTIILALKIIEKEIIEQKKHQKAIFILDDVFSELDNHRRTFLIQNIKDNQVFITTTDADMVVNHLPKNVKVIALSRVPDI